MTKRTGRVMERSSGARSLAGALATIAALIAAPGPLAAQGQDAPSQPDRMAMLTPDPADAEAAAVAVITELFDAMRESDAETMRGLFAEGVGGFPSSFVGPQGPTANFGGLDGFLETVAASEPGSLDEQFTVREVIVDDNLVTVVTPYTFTYQGNFSHCGVDVFLIARQGTDWKIVGLADTRRRAGCEGWLDE